MPEQGILYMKLWTVMFHQNLYGVILHIYGYDGANPKPYEWRMKSLHIYIHPGTISAYIILKSSIIKTFTMIECPVVGGGDVLLNAHASLIILREHIWFNRPISLISMEP